ncbi:hypothetical protein IRZ70_06910 [Pseudomonas monteilii]|nr:hypothetical protein [Pseudomonas monteilii]
MLDSLNSAQVVTSRIAEATAAVQMYIHRTLSRPEEKRALRQEVVDRQFFRDWSRWNARYATWAAGQMLRYYPENYIDPTIRLGQTKAMDDMLQMLGQAQVNADTVGDAFHGYLSAFEEVANLETVSGYHDSRNEKSGKSWFIGRTRGELCEYWWRTVDEGKRSAEGVLPANACAVFDGEGRPVVDNAMPVKAGSGIPAGFQKFDVSLKSVKIADINETLDRYSLVLDTLLTVEAKQPEVENKWVTALVHKYPALGQENQKVPTLARCGYGAFMVRKENDQYWG